MKNYNYWSEQSPKNWPFRFLFLDTRYSLINVSLNLKRVYLLANCQKLPFWDLILKTFSTMKNIIQILEIWFFKKFQGGEILRSNHFQEGMLLIRTQFGIYSPVTLKFYIFPEILGLLWKYKCLIRKPNYLTYIYK